MNIKIFILLEAVRAGKILFGNSVMSGEFLGSGCGIKTASVERKDGRVQR